jgi:hypothetical protein
MSLQHLAKHVAAKGRNGDTTLVHMTKGEVAGLQALAKHHGTTLTRNPDTGLPEAFSLKSLLPMAAGAALMATGVGAPAAAALVGGGMFAATGSLKQGLLAGLGAYGGAGLMSGVAGMGAAAGEAAVAGETTAAATEAVAAEQAKQAAIQTAGQQAVTPQAIEQVAADQAARNAVGSQAVWEQSARDYASNAAGTSAAPFTAATQQTLANPITSGFSAAVNNPGAYVNSLGGGMEAAKTAGMAAAPAISDAMEPKPVPEIKGDADMGQRYAFESGYDNNLPGRTGQPAYRAISNEQAKKLYGFADGGDVQYPYSESVVRMAAGGNAPVASSSGYGSYSPADANVAAYGLGTGIDYSGYDTAPNQGIAALASKVNPNQNIVDIYKKVEADQKAAADKKAAEEAAAAAPVSYEYGGMAAGGSISTLGGYSDGGRLLRGPGDGVSDSIPAVIGKKQPARLADGEFVVPARIVSEIGNGSTEAGARKLYAMMDRVQRARGKTVAKGKVAKNTRADKFLPA